MVTAHYLASAIMIGLAAILVNRVRRYFRADVSEREDITREFPPQKSGVIRLLGWIGLALVSFLLFMGTVVTGTGPHAGDPRTHRHEFDAIAVSRAHAWAVWAFLLLLIIMFVLVRKYAMPRAFLSSLLVLAAIMVYQGAIGYIQYNTGLPPLLVEAHMLGSGMFTWASLSLIERQLTLSSQKARARAKQRLAVS